MHQKTNKAAAQAKAALSNVTNFLGGVVHRLVEENNDNTADEDEEIVPESTFSGVTSSAATEVRSLMAFLSGVAVMVIRYVQQQFISLDTISRH